MGSSTSSKRNALTTVYLVFHLHLCFVHGLTLLGENSRNKQLLLKNSATALYLQSLHDDTRWMSEGLLISSFTNGLKNNKQAQDILRQGLERAMHQQAIAETEFQLANSVRASPCNGPNTQLLEQLEELDQGYQQRITVLSPLRVLYIPTAMYAPRPIDIDRTMSMRINNTTPGKQRQRARADAKKRRDDILEMIAELIHTDIHAVTMDLADGSVKQPEVCRFRQSKMPNDTMDRQKLANAPQTGRKAISDWKPHMIYLQGGNTFWLHYCMSGWRDDLRKAMTEGGTFFCGASAGAIVAGTVVATALWKGWDDPRVVPEPIDWNLHCPQTAGLSLLGPHHSCFPHYNNTWESTVAQEICTLREQIDPLHNVIAFADDQVVYVDGRKQNIHVISQS